MTPLLVALLSCTGPGPGVVREGDQLRVMAEGRAERVDKALEIAPSVKLHSELVELFEKGEFKVLVDAPEGIKNMPASVTVSPLFDDPAIKEAAWGTEEAELHKLVVEQGADFVVVRWDILASVDRGRWVASRLYHDDFREYFQLVAVDENVRVYRPIEAPMSYPPQLASLTADQIRARLRGEKIYPLDVKTEDGRKWNLVATARLPGARELATGMCMRDTYADCVVELANDLEREHRRYQEWYGGPKIGEQSEELIIEVHRVTERALILTDDRDKIESLWEMGIDGAIIIDTGDDKAAIIPGSVAYTRSYREADRMLRHGAQEFKMSSLRPWRESDGTLEKIRTIEYQELPGGYLVPLFRGVPPVPMEVVDLPALEESVVMGGEWYLRNLHPNDQPLRYAPGQVTYKMWPSENRYSDEYNLVRHTLATWNLVQAWQMAPERTEFLDGATRALDWTLTWQKSETLDDGTVITFIEYPQYDAQGRKMLVGDPSTPPAPVAEMNPNSNRKLGSIVVGMMGIIDLSRAKDTHEYDELLEEMGNFVLHMQDDDGRFRPYYVPPTHPYAKERNDIVPGEAALALVMLYEYTGDEKWIEPIPRYFEFYEGWWDVRETQKSTVSAWPAYQYNNQTRLDLVQFGPWSVMAANAYNRATGSEEGVDFALRVSDWMIDSYQWTEENAPWPDYVGGYYKMEGELPAMQAFCYAEGTAAAYQLATRVRPDQAAKHEVATRESMRFALQMQYDQLQIYPFSRGDEVYGGTRYAMNETKVRIDYVHHSLSAVYQYVLGARVDPNLPPGVELSEARVMMQRSLDAYNNPPPEAPAVEGEALQETPQ